MATSTDPIDMDNVDDLPIASTSSTTLDSSTSNTTSSISLTPLIGSQTSSTRALCHLLEFDDAKILLDAGVNPYREQGTAESYAQERRDYLERLKELAPQLTLVLLSSPTIESLGLLPYLVSKLRLACPIYATFPCRTLGQLTLEEWVEARASEEAIDALPADSVAPTSSTSGASGNPKARPGAARTTSSHVYSSGRGGKSVTGPTSDDTGARADDVAWRISKEEIQLAFSRITPVVYSQVIRLSGRANSPFSLLAHPAGTALGATLWSLRSATTDSLLYAPTFNHVKERTLDPASFLVKDKDGRMTVNEAIRRIGVLIIPAERASKSATKAKERDKIMLDTITHTLRETNQSILLPVDTIGRFIEILVLLEQHWAFSTLSPNYPLCLCSKNAEGILFTIRRLADAFGGQLGADEGERERVLRFKNVRMFESPEQLLARYPAEHPKLVLCAPASLSYGYSRQLLVSTFLSSPRCLILLTNPGQPASMTSHLFSLWNARQPASTRYGTGKVGEVVDFDKAQAAEAITANTTIRLKMRRKVVLQGEELMNYLEEQRLVKEKETKAKAMAERNRRMMEAHDENESSDSDSDSDGDSDQSDDEKAMRSEKAQARAVFGVTENGDMGDILNDENGNPASPAQGVGRGPAAFAEPGAGPVMKSWKRGLAKSGYEPGLTHAGTGAWDEFLDDVKTSQIGGFDIYVRQASTSTAYAALKNLGMSLANQAQNTRYRMFPYFERRRRVDGYGEAVDIEGWKTRNKAPEEIEAALIGDMDAEAAAAAATALGKRKRGDGEQGEDDNSAAQNEPPHKFITEDLAIQVRCKVLVVDMEGKADGRALRSILPLIEPKKLVLVNGDPESTQDLASALTSATMAEENILTPSDGEKMKIADVTKSFSLRLDDGLMTALSLRKIEGYEVVPVKGVIGQSDESTLPVLIPTSSLEMPHAAADDDNTEAPEDSKMEGDDGQPRQNAEATLPKLPAPHFIGEIKLALLKASLSAKNVPVSFSKGTLVCGPVKPQISAASAVGAAKGKDARPARLAKLAGATRPSPTPEREDELLETSGGKVVVRKQGAQLVLEGAPGDTFYTVRAAVYDLHAIASS